MADGATSLDLAASADHAPAMSAVDAVVVGSGPNGLAAAVALARAGHSVHVIEGAESVGGGLRTVASTLPGFLHDECSAIHPTGVLSPYLRTLPLGDHGLEWVRSPHSFGHPLDDGRAIVSERSLDAMVERLGGDGPVYRRLVRPFVDAGPDLFKDILAPFARIPHRPFLFARFGLRGLLPASWLSRRFDSDAGRALVAGCAAHSILPLDFWGTGAMALVFMISTHLEDWPCARGGSAAIGNALESLLKASGGTIETGRWVRSLADLPPHRVVLFDTTPRALSSIAGDALPSGFRARLTHFHYGPGVFKVDFALDGPIPWRAPELAGASTVHVGGTFAEIAASERAMWDGTAHERPFLIVCQQSHVDRTRAPDGKQTGYAYCHVPAGSTVDMTPAIIRQIERYAPGFRDRILAQHSTSPAAFEAMNPNLIGGAITGGAATLWQLFARPTLRLNPYTTPNPKLFLCSGSTPPGGGVHGMSGYWAARAAMKALQRQ